MSTVNNGPQIVRTGLILDLDASSVTSYSAIAVYKVECYSTFGGGLRSANYTVQYSDDNSTWTTAFTGVMSNNSSCGIITGTNRNDSNYSKHRYWRYVEGGAVVGHHPRVSRIDFITKSGAVYNLVTYTTDNCADSGTYIVGTVSKDFGTTTWRDTSGSGNNGTLGASTAAPTYSNQNGGSLVFDGSNDYVQTLLTGTFSQITFDYWGFFDDATLSTTSRNESAFGDWTSNRVHWGTRWSVGMHWNVNNAWVAVPTTNLRYGWNHFSLIWNNSASQKLIYINSILSSSEATNGNMVLGDFKIGVATSLNAYYRGNISNFRVYNRAVSASEIMQNFQATKSRFGL